MIEEYLTIEELSARLKLKPKAVKNKMALEAQEPHDPTQ